MSILQQLLNQRSSLSPSRIKILDYIVENQELCSEMTSQVLCEKIQVSQSSIIKFTQQLGYKGFTDFKFALIKEQNHKASLLNAHIPLHSKINDQDSILMMAQKLAQEKQQALLNTTNAINHIEFSKIIKLINSAARVQIMGIGGSALTAKDLSFKLLKIGIIALSEQDTHVQIATANTLKKGDVQILLSYSGLRKEILIAAKAARDKGATVIALTRKKRNGLRDIADYCIDTIADEEKYRSSSISSRTAQNAITDLIFMSLLQKRGSDVKLLMFDISSSINKI
ncbi:SIS domain-containing protein [Psychromonas sp. Urea-02u-13]|uniref:SIS domain-containing protein n=1 Tax=Psychromonas sp. Urea-02u-13 TaxID=2058326 RepID=UPI000C34978A|nr:SIS domain-containing protein [Psychromonas sp. Urea-02u-13]PKG39778.1 XRE family transcriptional regulator [Psychromonas sp. Urea-02u-13]